MNTMQQLVGQYLSYADRIASQRKRSLPGFIDIDELKSAAYLGLVEAASRYDASRNVKFTTFSFRRIVGAMDDYLREQGWMKRGDYRQMLSLDSTHNGDCTIGDGIEARLQNDAEECFEVITMKLNDQAKAILRHYFIDEYSMKEVGAKFGVSESRISQLIKTYKEEISGDADVRAELAA